MRFLMCPPKYFEVAYEINPWMSVERRVDRALAQKQWQALHDWLIHTAGAQVEVIEPMPGLPDMVFTANAGVAAGKNFIRSRFRHRERRGEEAHFEKWFKKQGFKIRSVPEPLIFEGEGDALFLGNDLYTGFHFRSDLEAHDAVAGILRVEYEGLELKDKRFYHLDTCFAPLNDKSALIFPEAFAPYARLTLLEMVPDPVSVPENEALRFACNAVIAGSHAALPLGCPVTAQAVRDRGLAVTELDFSEFIKAGGAGKCLVLKLP